MSHVEWCVNHTIRWSTLLSRKIDKMFFILYVTVVSMITLLVAGNDFALDSLVDALLIVLSFLLAFNVSYTIIVHFF